MAKKLNQDCECERIANVAKENGWTVRIRAIRTVRGGAIQNINLYKGEELVYIDQDSDRYQAHWKCKMYMRSAGVVI